MAKMGYQTLTRFYTMLFAVRSLGRACLIPYLGLLVPDPFSQSVNLSSFAVSKRKEYRGSLYYHPSAISEGL